MSHLICKINLSPHYLRCLDSIVVSMSDLESDGPGLIPSGCYQTFFLFFPLFLPAVNVFSLVFFSSFQSRMMYHNKSEKL